MIIYVATVGKLLAKSFQSFYGKFCYCCTCKSKQNEKHSVENEKVKSFKLMHQTNCVDENTKSNRDKQKCLVNKNDDNSRSSAATDHRHHHQQHPHKTLISGDHCNAPYSGESNSLSYSDDKQTQMISSSSALHVAPLTHHPSNHHHHQQQQHCHTNGNNYYATGKYHNQPSTYHLHTHTLARTNGKSQNDLTLMMKSRSLDRRTLQQHMQQQQQQSNHVYDGCTNSTSIGGLSSGIPALTVANWADPSNNPYLNSTATATASSTQCNYGYESA